MPVTLALDQRQITIATGSHGSKLTKPALDSYWMEQVDFLTYQPPPDDVTDTASEEEWMERMDFIQEDLGWLLKLPHHRFWSQVVFDESLQQCLDSYLRSAPRPYDPVTSLTGDLAAKHHTIHKLVFMAFLRMSTHKESKESFITPGVFGEIIYENYLFDVAKLMELCILYGGGNSELLRKMMQNIFRMQPKFNEDLTAAIPTIIEVFDKLLGKCGLKSESDNLQASPTDRVLHTLPVDELGDLIHYITDSALSTLAFLEIYPEGAAAFQAHSYMSAVAAFFETMMPAMEGALQERHWDDRSTKKSFEKHLKLGKASLAKTCQCIVATCHIQPITENTSRDEVSKLVEVYLELMSSLLSDKHFLSAFARQYNIGEDLDVVLQKAHVDETRAQFILDGFRSASAAHKKVKAKHPGKAAVMLPTEVHAQGQSGIGASYQYQVAPEDYQTDEYIEEFAPSSSGACGGGLSEVQMVSLISSVKDLFPDYGEGFIEVCLEEYTYDSSKVIHAILEDKLVPSLRELDKTMARAAPKPPVPKAQSPKETKLPPSLLQQRRNIYQNDEFDVFSRDTVDTNRIHKGKKTESLTAKKLMDDKTHLQSLRSTYEEYSYEYDDEYDDTYDANDVGAGDADSADELTSRRPFMVPRVLRGTAEDSSSGDDDDQDQQPPPPNQNTGRNDRQTHNSHQQPNRGTGRGAVQGRGRGRGQTKETHRARGAKEQHKGSRANHNRKAMADKKRNKGMGPLP